MSMIDPRSVEIFWWVVRLGGFRRAAERLGTTQPAVSARIAALEASVGGRLLDRGARRRIAPTAKGLLLLAFAERQMALAAEMQAALTGPDRMRGAVRLGVAETLVHTWLPSLLHRLHEAYPRMEVDLVVDVSANLRTALLAGEIDVALSMGPIGAPGVHDIGLCEYPLAWVAAAGFDRGGGALGLEELAACTIVTYPRATLPYQQVRALFAGSKPPRIFANASLASIVRMVLDGIGIGVIAPAAIGPELARGELVLLRTTAALPALRFTASWRADPDSALGAAVAHMAHAVASSVEAGAERSRQVIVWDRE